MRVRDLEDWPGTFSVNTSHGDTVPTHASQITIGATRFAMDDSVSFMGTFEGNKECLCRLAVPNRKTSNGMAIVLCKYKGKTLLSIADVEVPKL